MAAPPALLLVFIDPGEKIPLDEFNDWYDNDHIAARTRISAFQNWTRLEQVDKKKPVFGAIYDLKSFEETQSSSYTSVLRNPSEKEKTIIARIGEVDRGIYELLPGDLPSPSPAWDEKKASPFWGFVMIDVKPEVEEEFNKWYNEEHLPMIAKCPGWLRSRRFVLKDWGRFGGDVPKDPSAPPKYLAAYEWTSLDGLQSEEMKAVLGTPWMAKLQANFVRVETRQMKFYKSFERT